MHVRENVTQPTDPSYRLIPLTQGQVCKVDTADYDWLMQWNWHADMDRKSGKFYARCRMGKKVVKMARLILNITDPKIHADHHNHDTLDNRRWNIRRASSQQNRFNMAPVKDSASGIRGVDREGSMWVARIQVNGKKKHLGTFPDAESASRAHQDASRKFFGEFSFYH